MTVLDVKKQLAGQLQPKSTTPQTDADDLASYVLMIAKGADDAMASTATAETHSGFVMPWSGRLRGAKYVATTGGVTGNASNFGTITISKRDSAFANQTTIATYTTNATPSRDVTQNVPAAFDSPTPAAGGASIAAGSAITWTITKTGSGVVLRQGFFVLDFVKE